VAVVQAGETQTRKIGSSREFEICQFLLFTFLI